MLIFFLIAGTRFVLIYFIFLSKVYLYVFTIVINNSLQNCKLHIDDIPVHVFSMVIVNLYCTVEVSDIAVFFGYRWTFVKLKLRKSGDRTRNLVNLQLSSPS